MPLQSLQLATVRSSPSLGRRVARATNKINPSVVIAFLRDINLQEMQHHARLLRCEHNKWQRFAGRELYGGRGGSVFVSSLGQPGAGGGERTWRGRRAEPPKKLKRDRTSKAMD